MKNRLEGNLARIECALEHFLRSDPQPVANLHEGLLYALGLDQDDRNIRGKRIRPALCLVACEALGGDARAAVPFAMAIELMHNFFLVHDDIEDGDQFRRGRPSCWVKYGLAHGVNIGDYLYAKVFEALLSGGRVPETASVNPALQLGLLQLLVDTLDRTHIGQAQDINARAQRDFSLDGYLELVRNKTGYYLAAPMIGGAMIAGAQEETLEALREFGKNVGPVFQIIDDIIDLTHGKGRESTGSDIREGKRSYLVAYTASMAKASDREELFRILDLPREQTSDSDVESVRALFAQYGAVEAGRAYCENLMAAARRAVAIVDPELREALTAIFEDMLDRKK